LAPHALDGTNPLHRALLQLGKALESEKGVATDGATKGFSM
jgi:hypothetical protein